MTDFDAKKAEGLSLSVSMLALTLPAFEVAAELSIVFPSDAGVINVAEFGALPNDGVDDTLAIQAAMNSVSFQRDGTPLLSGSDNHILYFANGRYDVSDMLEFPGRQKRLIWQGQSESGVEIRLADNLGWNASDNKAILRTGSETADRFRNAVRNMTFNVGSGNPHANGLQFFASNQGTVKNVTIRSEDGSGASGLDMAWDDAIGPLLIENVTVEGFDVGVDARWQTASQTFHDVTVRNQNTYGFRNQNNQAVFIQGFQSVQKDNAVTALANLSNTTEAMVVTDAHLIATGGHSTMPAIGNQRNFYGARLSIEGYAQAIRNGISSGRGNPGISKGTVEEHWALGDEAALGAGPDDGRGPALAAFASPNRSMRLPVKHTPQVAWEQDLSQWAGPQHFGGIADDGMDDTHAIQAAIDSGATHVYFPNGKWTIDGEVVLRGNVTRLIGTEANLETTNGNGTIRVGNGSADVVVIERLESNLGESVNIEQATARTLVLNSLKDFEYTTSEAAADPGELFINDFVGHVSFRNQHVWARQLNVESDTEQDPGEPAPEQAARIINDGGRVWLSGVKTEQDGTVVLTINGGETELLGHIHIGSGSSQSDPRYVTRDASFSAAGWVDQVGGSGGFDFFARETRGGDTRTVSIGGGLAPNLYTAFPFTKDIDDPELWLPADGDALDASRFGHVTRPTTGLRFVDDGPIGQAFAFDGTSEYVDITTGVLQQPVVERTLSFHLRPHSLNGIQTLYEEGGANGGLSLRLVDSAVEVAVTDGTSLTTLRSGSLHPDQWTHIAFTFSHGKLRLYIDSELTEEIASSFAAVPWHPGDPSTLGATRLSDAFGGVVQADHFLHGDMDDVRLWGVALKPNQISDLAAIPEPASTAAWFLICVFVTQRLGSWTRIRTMNQR